MGAPGSDGKRTVLFFRDFRRFHGGHLKVWDYFNHVLASPGFEPRIEFAPKTRWGEDNPWRESTDYVVEPGSFRPDVYFVAGRDWKLMDRHPAAGAGLPVVNLLQGMRHADPESNRFEFLGRKAIRVCVSDEVAAAVRETGVAEGPLTVIPNGLDLGDLPAAGKVPRDVDLLVISLKRPELGAELVSRLGAEGRSIDVLGERVSRPEFLSRILRARATVFLPLEEEGFYLPALEGMALGTVVVCPDCVGNRSFCLDGRNSFRPAYELDALVEAAATALSLNGERATALVDEAGRTAAAHSLEQERRAFLEVLDDVDRLW